MAKRHPNSKKNWLQIIRESLQGTNLRIGQGISNRGWEIWDGSAMAGGFYVGLLVRPLDGDKWAMTHNALDPRPESFKYDSPLEACRANMEGGLGLC